MTVAGTAPADTTEVGSVMLSIVAALLDEVIRIRTMQVISRLNPLKLRQRKSFLPQRRF